MVAGRRRLPALPAVVRRQQRRRHRRLRGDPQPSRPPPRPRRRRHLAVSPCFPSPQADHGYDVADYFDIEPDYGTLADFDRTLAEAKERGIRIMLDIVPNHCSSDHAWFQAALKAAPGSPERARFWFKDGKGPNGDEPPNNWRAIFGGPAWTRVTEADGTPGQWYEHTFTPGQPDFNWYNQDVIDYFDRMLTFWFDRGVEGIRVDAVPVLGKHPDMPDSPPCAAGLTDGQAWRLQHLRALLPERPRRVEALAHADRPVRGRPSRPAPRHHQRVVRHAGADTLVPAGRRVPPELRLRTDADHVAGQADARRHRRLARHARVRRRAPRRGP